MEMVLVDEKEHQIQAFIKKSLVIKYMMELEEGKSYLMQNFVVCQNGGEYKATNHSFKINFQYSTAVKELDLPTIPKNVFNFTSLEDIISMKIDDSFLISVIGEVTQIGDVQMTNNNGKQSRRVNVMLEDNKNRWISITLWDEYCDQVSSYVTFSRVPIIMIMQYAKIRKWKGVVYLSNCMFCTHILLDADIPAAIEFKERLSERGDRSPTVSLLTSYNSSIGDNDFFREGEKKTLDEIGEMKEVCVCVVLATVVCIETKYSWFYNSCKQCKKKVIPEQSKFYCEKCDKHVDIIIPRYKVQVRVMDETSSATFVIFDREMIQVIGKSVTELRAELAKDGDMDFYPEELQSLVNRKFLFRIKVNSNSRQQEFVTFPVMKMTGSEKIIESFIGNNNKTDEAQESTVDVSDLDNLDLKSPASSKKKELIDGEMSTNGVPLKKVKIEKVDDTINLMDV